jgi:hypothetical protein
MDDDVQSGSGREYCSGDKNYHAVLDRADAYVERNGLDLPLDPDARRVYPEPAAGPSDPGLDG